MRRLYWAAAVAMTIGDLGAVAKPSCVPVGAKDDTGLLRKKSEALIVPPIASIINIIESGLHLMQRKMGQRA